MQQIFKVRNLKSTNNKLCNKRLPSATVNQRTNTVECHHIDEIPTVTWYVKQLTRAEFPLSLNHCLSYFEAEVVGASEEQTYNIGLISKDGNMRQYAGRTINSIGYSKNSSDQKFEIYLSKKKISSLSHDKLKLKDRIGCGVKCQNRTFFFTKNGTMIMQDIPIPLCWSQFYPAVGMNCKDEALRCYFNYDQCVFNVAMYAKSIETIIRKEIQEGKTPNAVVYSLVQQYLNFNSYKQTLELMNSKDLLFTPLQFLTRNQTVTVPDICIQKQKQSQLEKQREEERQIEKQEVAKEEENSMSRQQNNVMADQETLRFQHFSRHRIMSDQLEDSHEFMHLRRKNTETINDLEMNFGQDSLDLFRKERKLSLISNLSNCSNRHIQNQSALQIESMVDINENNNRQATFTEEFLAKQRIDIMRLTKKGLFQQALQLLKSKIPKLLELEPVLETFFKAHIFLRKIKQQSCLAAINYGKEQRQFNDNKDHLFPFYNADNDNLQWAPMKNIFKALASKDQPNELQFEAFSQYVNSVILKRLGYLPDSRLGLYLQNTRRLLDKLTDYKGMTCGIELGL